MNKKLGMIIGVVVLLLVLGGGGYMLLGKQDAKKSADEISSTDQEIGTLEPGDIGLELAMTNGNKKVKVMVAKANDIESLEYEITYEADVPAAEQVEGGEDRVSRGFSEEAALKSGQSSYESKEFDLGSCSKNVCRYDTGVTEIEIIMKVIKRDGKIYQVKDSLEL